MVEQITIWPRSIVLKAYSLVAIPLLLLAGCASAPQIVRSGPFDAVRGKSVQILAAGAPADAGTAGRADALVMAQMTRLGALPAPADGRGDYQLQVSFSAIPAGVAVSRSGKDAPIEDGWASPPLKRRLLDRPARAGYALTVVALDSATGKVALSATATDRNGDPADKALPLLTAAMFAPAPAAH